MAGAECAARSTIRDSHDRWLDCLVSLRFHKLAEVFNVFVYISGDSPFVFFVGYKYSVLAIKCHEYRAVRIPSGKRRDRQLRAKRFGRDKLWLCILLN